MKSYVLKDYIYMWLCSIHNMHLCYALGTANFCTFLHAFAAKSQNYCSNIETHDQEKYLM